MSPVGPALAFWMRELGLECEVRLAPYHQVFQQLLDPGSLLAGAVVFAGVYLTERG